MKRFFIFVCALVVGCQGRPSGAPESACSSLTPVHSGILPQRTSSTFSVSVVRIGDKIRVKISSSVGEEFEGFVLQARSSNERQQMIDGQFTGRESVSRTLSCFGGSQNTLTQVNPSPKREVVTEWTPANGVNEDVIFRVTVAKTFALFWTEIDSTPIRIRSDSNSTSQHSKKEMDSQKMYQNCSVSKGCFGLPPGCITRTDCEVLLTFASGPDGIAFQMYGFLQPQTYMAMGISMDHLMGDDAVTECFVQDSTVVLRESWNNDKNNVKTIEVPKRMYEGDYTNGLMTCSWTKRYTSELSGKWFDLSNSSYYTLLAKGPMESKKLMYHSSKLASREAVNFAAFETIRGEVTTDSIKIHGTFMVTAWVGLVSLAILLARHFKSAWETRTMCGVKIWFALHRGLNIAAMLFIIIAFIIIFVHKNGWNYETTNPHAVFGCIATTLGVFQPFMAAFRPATDHPKRPIFNWFHWIVGNVAQIIAVIAIFFAVSLQSSGLSESFYWGMAIFVIIHLIFHLLFQVHAWISGRKKNNEVKMVEMTAGRRNIQNVPEKSLGDNVFSVLLLGIYIIFLVVTVLALYALIGVA